jgi:hypothetical protein
MAETTSKERIRASKFKYGTLSITRNQMASDYQRRREISPDIERLMLKGRVGEDFPTPPTTAESGPADLASLVTSRIISLNTASSRPPPL